MMFEKSWKKEVARDTLALGGIAFYFIVIGRSFVANYYTFVWQIVIAALIILIASLIFKNADYHIGRGLTLVIFTILFYNDWRFSIFASILFLAMIFCSLYIWKSWKKLVGGILIGSICSVLAYYIVSFLRL